MGNLKKKKEFWGEKNKLRLSLRRRNSFFWPKNREKFDNKVQKLPNFKEKKGLFKPKNKLGLSLRRKKRFFGPKIDQFKKKNEFWAKKQVEAELKKKKDIFWAKNWEKIEYIG